jgi:xanthine dehydrogenase FAD-binding subunit
MPLWKNYHLAQSVTDALLALSKAPGAVCLIAGGTDLLLDLQQGRHPTVDTLVDIANVPEFNCLEVRGEKLFVGAAVPLNRIVASQIIQEHAQALVEACDLIGGPQVRNTATLGGNVAHALPAADGTIALLALDAEAEIASLESRRFTQLKELFVGPGKSALDARREVLLGFHLTLCGAGEASAFRRVMRPQGVALPVLNMAVWLKRWGDVIADIRLALGPAGPTPRRAYAAEDVLRGNSFDKNTFDSALEALVAEASFRTSPYRASAAYRRHLSGVLLAEIVKEALARAESTLDPDLIIGHG